MYNLDLHLTVNVYNVYLLYIQSASNQSISAYVCFIMLFNAVSFLIIVVCYAGMFLSIRASHSWNSNDTIVAKRMALLVFTDFFCWAPIIFFSLTAAFGWQFARIGLDEAKVLTIFVLPLNSCANPFLYAFFTRQFKRDCVKLCKRIEESSISRHLSSSGVGRSSTAPNRTIHAVNNRGKRNSCDQLMNEPSTSADPSSSSSQNASDDSDLTVKKLLLTPEEKQILRYVRSESAAAKHVKNVKNNGIETHCHNRVNLVPVRRLRNLPTPSEGIIEDDADSAQDIILHTTEGNVYLTAKGKSQKGTRPRTNLLKQKVIKDMPSKCAKRLCNHATTSSNSASKSPVESRTVESQTVETGDVVQSENEITQQKPVSLSQDKSTVTKRFEAERSKQLGLKINHFTKTPLTNNGQNDEVVYKTTATQTDLNLQLPSTQIYRLQRAIAKQEKDKHINEWRKTSHLSFLWRSSGAFDTVAQKQKSNSLVELTRPTSHMQISNKRHSLTSKHEGYILLKNTSRDSAYEDDDMYEFYEPRAAKENQKHKTSIEYKNAVFEDRQTERAITKVQTELSLESEEVTETSILLADNLCLPKNRNCCDNESGISSSS